jgi:hypothetical protein
MFRPAPTGRRARCTFLVARGPRQVCEDSSCSNRPGGLFAAALKQVRLAHTQEGARRNATLLAFGFFPRSASVLLVDTVRQIPDSCAAVGQARRD